MNNKKTLLAVLGRGGHTEQLLKLIDLLGKEYNYEYVIASEDLVSEKRIKFRGRVFKIINPRRMDDKNILKVILKFIPSTIQLISVILRSKAKFVVMCGPALCLHIAVLSKLVGKKVIFLESWSRVYTKSWAGNAVYKLNLADLFFVQWKEEMKNYPKAIYAGRLG